MYYNKVLDYVVAEEDSVKIAVTLRNLGIVHHSQGRLQQAKDWYQQSIDIGKNIKDTVAIVRGLTSMGFLYSDQGDYVKAIEIGLEALTIAELVNSIRMQSDILSNLGILYGKMGDYNKSLAYHLLTLKMDNSTQDLRGISYAMNNIGLVYKKMGNTDSALVYYHRSLEIKRKMADRYGITTGLNNLGTIYKEEGNFDKALECFNEAILIADSAELVLEKSSLLVGKASILVEEKRYNEAREFYLQSLEIAERENLQEDIRDVYLGLADLYEKKGEFKNTVTYLKLYSTIKDSILNESSQRSIAEMQTRFETEKKEKEIQILTQKGEIQDLKLRKQRTQLWILAGGILFIIILGYFILSSYRLRQQNYRTILEKRNLETEQRLLRSQMNPHFIFNSLNSIQSFISGNDSFTAMTYLSKFASLMRFIMENSRKSMIPLSDELKTLELYIDLERIRFKEKFDFKIELTDQIIPETMYVPPMLLQPIVENAIQHGLRHKKGKGLLELDFSIQEQMLKCIINDNGVGREQAEKLKKDHSRKHQSLGMTVTRERIKALKKEKNIRADMKIADLKDKEGMGLGTSVKVIIPYEEEYL